MHADIVEFRGEHRWLSNFWIIPGGIYYRGMHAPTVEHIYQASKALFLDDALFILEAEDAGTAKRRGALLASDQAPARIRPDWPARKLLVMAELTRLKYQEPGLRAQLLSMNGATITEGNRWHDTFFGVCHGSRRCGMHEPMGQNNLGRLLMVERSRIIAEETLRARLGGDSSVQFHT